ncbi:FAD/NAD(P)-binding domain-containing protein [Westerdykella ornata]|uniref:FAD/NAD(P)-binding domain-containing protein n=1 Tax=Westerdykella ornata TaxID=318751 RepID=A0A6A6K226_WESOR|nr:FAD/NAD(P)-binding domain-containing protein [Westerdykella ornata]KAF2281439.1 FAD/NAD(P)-binding domain-containing protein [Westerdykella ornata]
MSAVPNIPTDIPPLADHAAVNGIVAPNFQLSDSPIENLRPLKVIVIGAGYSGIYLGIRIPEKLRNVDLVIYEKNPGVGGTWYDNRYPGCACDIPSHSYQYSFEPNHHWSSLYAPSREIQAYLESVAKKYSADRFIKLSHEVTNCRWDDEAAKWHVTVKDLTTGSQIDDSCDVLISARGNLNTPSWPDIDGLDTFKGEVMHSARWNEKYDFTGKRIGVIGSGSSSIQIVPSLQRLPSTTLTVFARSKTWISPPFGQHLWDKHGFTGFEVPADIRSRFATDDEFYHAFRLAVEEDGNAIHAFTIQGTEMQKGAKQMFTEHMQKRLASAPHILDALLPSFSPGCRRLTPGPGYLEALTQSNVTFTSSPITRISESAIHTADGKAHEIDALVCATGFQAGMAAPFPVTGLDNVSMRDKWSQRARTYLSHSISSFPNFFIMLGPNASIGSGSLTMMIECVGDYIVRCIRKLQRENYAAMMVKRDREEDFLEYVDRYFEGTVFAEECASWYKNKERKVTGLWPGSTLHCIEAMRAVRWEDFVWRPLGEAWDEDDMEKERDGTQNGEVKPKKKRTNRLAWLGNGWSVNQLEEKHLAWYIYPEFVEKPVAPLPEEHPKYNIRTFSY